MKAHYKKINITAIFILTLSFGNDEFPIGIWNGFDYLNTPDNVLSCEINGETCWESPFEHIWDPYFFEYSDGANTFYYLNDLNIKLLMVRTSWTQNYARTSQTHKY